MKTEFVTGFNKEVWIPEIESLIKKWEDFSNSCFCELDEDKASALDTANLLRQFLAALKADTITKELYHKCYLFIFL